MRIATLALPFLFAATTAAAQSVDSAKPSTLVDAMQGMGYKAELGTDAIDDPMITSGIDGSKYRMLFFGCESNADCDGILFSASYVVDGNVSKSDMNDWNEATVVANAYLDSDGDPTLQFYLPMKGGISQSLFKHSVELWGEDIAKFKDHIGF